MPGQNTKKKAATKRKPVPGHWRQGSLRSASRTGYDRFLDMQRTVGNQATIRFLQKNVGGPVYDPGLESLAKGHSGTGRQLPNPHREWLEKAAGALPPIFIKDDAAVEQGLNMKNAHAATQGVQIFAVRDAFEGEEGKVRLAHEVAHVLQQRSENLPLTQEAVAEADADSFARSVQNGRPARVNVSAPTFLAYDSRRLKTGDKVKSITIAGGKAIIYMSGADGTDYTLIYTVEHNIPPREEPYKLKHGKGLVGLPEEIKGWISLGRTRKGDPLLDQSYFPEEVDLNVRAESDLGEGELQGQREEKAGKPVETKDRPEDIKAPKIKVSDPEQIEALKRKGLIEVETANQIKSKLEENVTLTYEEAVALIDAFNRVVVQGEGKEWKEAGESWLKWAKFIKENQDKISGRVKAGEKGISVEEVKDILKKHKEYVGIEDVPAKTTKQALYDPEKRKSWNSLSDWEKKLWNDYEKKYGSTADVTDSSTKDLRITKAVRFSMALRMSPKYMPSGASEAAEQLFNDPLFIGATMAGITVYLALWLAPEPVFTKAAAVLTTIGLLSLVTFSASEIINLAKAWMALSDASGRATKLEDLETAAEIFGKAIGGSGLRILVALTTVVGGKLLPTPKPLPPPTGGGGGMMGAGAGGGGVVITRPVAVPAVKVLPDGTIIVVGPSAAGIMMASGMGGGGSGPTGKPEAKPGQTPSGRKSPLEKVQEWENSGKIKGDYSRLKKDLQSKQKAVRKAAEAEVKAMEVKIRSGEIPEEVPLVAGKSVLGEYYIDKYGTFANRPGDKLAGHEMLQNAWLKAKSFSKGHGSGSASRDNPAVALSREVHTAVGREQAKLGLHNQKNLVKQTAKQNIELNAKAMRNAGVPEDVIQVLKAEAIKHAATVTGSP